jgi:hypothetical protein
VPPRVELEGKASIVQLPLELYMDGQNVVNGQVTWGYVDEQGALYKRTWTWLAVAINAVLFFFCACTTVPWFLKAIRTRRTEKAKVERTLKGPSALLKRLEFQMKEEDIQDPGAVTPLALEECGVRDIAREQEKERGERMQERKLQRNLDEIKRLVRIGKPLPPKLALSVLQAAPVHTPTPKPLDKGKAVGHL